MLTSIHPATVTLVLISLMLLTAVPIAAWQTLEKTDDPLAARQWFGGLLANAVAIFLLVPPERDPAISGIAYAMIGSTGVLMASALRRISGRKPIPRILGLGFLGATAVVTWIYEALGGVDAFGRAAFLYITAALDVWVMFELVPLYRRHRYRSIVLMGVSIIAVGVVSAARATAFFGWGMSPYFLSFSPTGQAGWVVNLVSSVLLSFGYWNFELERTRQAELEARLKTAEAMGRAEQAERHNTQLLEVVRERDEMLIVNSRLTGLSSASVFGAAMIHELNQYLEALTARLGAATLMGQKADRALRDELSEAAKLTEAISASIRPLRTLLVTGVPSREPVAVASEVTAVCRIIENACAREDIAFSLELAPEATRVTCLCDRALLVRVVMNIANNALQELTRPDDLPPGAERSIRVRIDCAPVDGGEVLRISITDSGHGFPPDMIASFPSLMDTRKESGTGIGLALAQIIARSWGGEISIANDRGARVMLSIPVSAQSRARKRGAA